MTISISEREAPKTAWKSDGDAYRVIVDCHASDRFHVPRCESGSGPDRPSSPTSARAPRC